MGGLATPYCGNADESMMPREICRPTERSLAIRESPCVVKWMKSDHQQGEATFSQDVASSNVLPPSDA